MTDWHVGMQVVCVANAPEWLVSFWERKLGIPLVYPVKGLVYTIRSFGVVDPRIILLGEVHNEVPDGCSSEPGFDREHFRPVRKTNIDCFLSLLNKTPTEREVAATTSLPGAPSLPDLIEQGSCHYPDALECRLPAGGAPCLRPPRAADLASNADGRRPLPLHSLQSPMPSSSSPMFAMNHGDDGHGIH